MEESTALIAMEGPVGTEADMEATTDNIKAVDSWRGDEVMIPSAAHLMRGREVDAATGTTIMGRGISQDHLFPEG